VTFTSIGDFLYMGGHWLEVWLSWGIGLAIVAGTMVHPVRARRRFFAEERRRLARERERIAQSGNNDASTTP
jgi:heme exporter protein D